MSRQLYFTLTYVVFVLFTCQTVVLEISETFHSLLPVCFTAEVVPGSGIFYIQFYISFLFFNFTQLPELSPLLENVIMPLNRSKKF